MKILKEKVCINSTLIFAETKAVSQQGIQLFVEFPDAGYKKKKKIDVEMMMKRKMNRVKKEYQVYMHKVHVLCWLGHGNYVNGILNDQDVMAAALTLVPSKECYPGERVDMKYVEQITTWYKDKLTLKQDKNEDKFKPNARPLNIILLDQIIKRIVTAKKYLAYIFVAMLRALGLQCRVMFNFVTLPLKPPTSELCSLSTKSNEQKANEKTQSKPAKDSKIVKPKQSTSKGNLKVPQLDGNDDECLVRKDLHVHWNNKCDPNEVIMQLDGNDDAVIAQKIKPVKRPKTDAPEISPPKIQKKSEGNSPKTIASLGKNKSNKNEVQVSKKNTNKKCTLIDSGLSVSNAKTPEKVSIKSQTCNNTNEQPKGSRILRSNIREENKPKSVTSSKTSIIKIPQIIVLDETNKEIASEYFQNPKGDDKIKRLSRKRSLTANPNSSKSTSKIEEKTANKVKVRTKSAPGSAIESSKCFESRKLKPTTPKRPARKAKEEKSEDEQRVSHKDLAKSSTKGKTDVTGDLVHIIKNRIKESKLEANKYIVKGKLHLLNIKKVIQLGHI